MKKLIIKDITTNSREDADNLYARAFRWMLYTENHPDVHVWMKRIKTDYSKSRIYIEMYEDTTGHADEMLMSITKPDTKDRLILDHLDSSMKVQFSLVFSGLSVMKHSVRYDYKSSDALTHKLLISFKKMQRKLSATK